TRSMSPLVVSTPVAPAAQTSAATVPTVEPLVARKQPNALPAVALLVTLPVTVLATSHRSTLPAATTARFAAVMAPAPPAVCVTRSEERRVGKELMPAPVLAA